MREDEIGEDKDHIKSSPQTMLGSLSLPWAAEGIFQGENDHICVFRKITQKTGQKIDQRGTSPEGRETSEKGIPQ